MSSPLETSSKSDCGVGGQRRQAQVGIPTLFDLVELEQSDLIEEIA